MLRILCVALVACAATPAASHDYRRGDRITGHLVQIIDGDTLRFRTGTGKATVDVRLHGIDAPEAAQRCRDATGALYACGVAATQHMADLLGVIPAPCPSPRLHGVCVGNSSQVTCTVTDTDRRHGRPVARCATGTGTDINSAMVAAGWARAYTAYSRDYATMEAIARGQQRGLWAGTAENPAAVRRADGRRRPSVLQEGGGNETTFP